LGARRSTGTAQSSHGSSWQKAPGKLSFWESCCPGLWMRTKELLGNAQVYAARKSCCLQSKSPGATEPTKYVLLPKNPHNATKRIKEFIFYLLRFYL
jgi:hypothetical protein